MNDMTNQEFIDQLRARTETVFAPPTIPPPPGAPKKKKGHKLLIASLTIIGLALGATGFIVAKAGSTAAAVKPPVQLPGTTSCFVDCDSPTTTRYNPPVTTRAMTSTELTEQWVDDHRAELLTFTEAAGADLPYNADQYDMMSFCGDQVSEMMTLKYGSASTDPNAPPEWHRMIDALMDGYSACASWSDDAPYLLDRGAEAMKDFTAMLHTLDI